MGPAIKSQGNGRYIDLAQPSTLYPIRGSIPSFACRSGCMYPASLPSTSKGLLLLTCILHTWLDHSSLLDPGETTSACYYSLERGGLRPDSALDRPKSALDTNSTTGVYSRTAPKAVVGPDTASTKQPLTRPIIRSFRPFCESLFPTLTRVADKWGPGPPASLAMVVPAAFSLAGHTDVLKHQTLTWPRPRAISTSRPQPHVCKTYWIHI